MTPTRKESGAMLRAIFCLVWLIPLIGAKQAYATEIQRIVSPAGIEAWLVEERSIPMLSVEIAWNGGAAQDPLGREGLANMLSGLLDEGAGELDSQSFQARLEDLAIELSFDAGKDTFRGSLRTLTKNRDEALELLTLALTAPRFDDEPVDRIRRQIIATVLRDEKNPRRIVGQTWFKKAFPDHPYGRQTSGTVETIEAITAADLKAYVQNVLALDNLTIAVVGDIGADELADVLDRIFGALPAESRLVPVEDVTPKIEADVEAVGYPSPQSVVMFGMPGLKRDDPDYYAAYVMNYILGGGGLSSRLNEAVREKRGLTYSVYSYLNPLRHSGLMMGGLASSNETVVEALEISFSEIERLRQEPISEEELSNAKTYLNGSFPLRLTSNAKIAQMLLAIQRLDLGIDYLDRRAELINSVTTDDVRRVADRLLDRNNIMTIIVGNPAGLTNGG